MKTIRFRMIAILVVLGLVTLSCGTSAPTPDPNIPLNMSNVCEFDGQVVEIEGKVVLPNGITCSSGEEVDTCALQFIDPLQVNSMEVFIPVSNNVTDLPQNYMAALPGEYQRNDFYFRTGDNRYGHDGSFVSIRGKVDSSPCNLYAIESITLLDRLEYQGIEIRRLPLQQALSEGLIEIEIKGVGLSQVFIKIKPKIEINMEIEIQPGTTFIAGTEGVQSMVVRERELVYVKPQAEVSFEAEVSCANMHLTQPTFSDTFTVSQDPRNEDLVRLFAVEDFYFAPLPLQQFAVWTITDNPEDPYDYVNIEFGGYSYSLYDEFIIRIRSLFEQAGIDTTKYLVFNN